MPAQPPPLPPSAPPELREFVACRSDELLLEVSDVGWIPRPHPAVPAVLLPTASATRGRGPDTVELIIRWAFVFRLRLHAAIVDGKLRIRGGGPLAGPIARWVDQFNAFLGDDRRLESLDVANGRVLLRKRRSADT